MISKRFLLCVFLMIPVLAGAQQIENLDLSQYQWENRLLLIFAPTADINAYQQQLAELEDAQAGIEERDLKIFHLLQVDNAFVNETKIARSQVERLIRVYKVNPRAFTIILIGMDGTEKLRQDEPISAKKLFAVIDAMPMRRQ